MKKIKRHHLYRFLEFFVVGFLMGIAEDLIAIRYATDAAITWNVVVVAALVALPFAAFSELIVDWKHQKYICEKQVKSMKKAVKGTTKLLGK